jgi:hypothetical protein
MSDLQATETKTDLDVFHRVRSSINSTASPVTEVNARDGPPPAIDDTYRGDLWWSRIRRRHQDAFSEFFGTFILILFGTGSVAQVVLSKGANGPYQSINWGK